MDKIEDITLGIGDLHFTDRPARIRTLLGSCVSITLWHPKRHIGGMCHFMLPSRGRKPPGAPLDGRYADEAMALFDLEFARRGTRAAEYQAKIFGGGDMFPDHRSNRSRNMDVGTRNIDTAHRLLAARGIRIVAEHLGGNGHRRLVFDLRNGDAWLAFRHLDARLPAPGAIR